MTSLLIKIFIKNYENIKDENVRKKYGELGSFVGIFSNVLLFLIKLAIGIIINSVAIMADSFNNLSDTLASVVTLFGFKLGSKPADKEHPFGHGRMEYVAGLIVSFIILLIGFEFFRASFIKILKPEQLYFNYVSIIILFITVLIKIWQALFNTKIGKLINSHSLVATAADSRNDVIVTLTSIISLFILKFFNINLDGYFGLIVSIFLIYSGYSLAKETLSPLLGESINQELAKNIKDIVLSFDGVLGVHDILVHNYGPNKSIASLHVEVPNNVCIDVSHQMVDAIENRVKKELGIFLTIHIDPVNLYDERIFEIISELKKLFSEYPENIDSHDHRIVDGRDTINFIFDLVIPYEFSAEKQNQLVFKIKERVSALDKRYKCIINIEKSFINYN